MLDEPTDGLDPNQKRDVRALIDAMARKRTILISTHLLEEVRALCNRVLIVARGKLLADATPAELEARSRYHGAVSFSASGSGRGPRHARTHAGRGRRRGRPAGWTRDGAARSRVARILAPVQELLRAQGLNVTEIQLERGRLEEVFRSMTSADAKDAA